MYNIAVTLGQRRRRWANVTAILDQHIAFAEFYSQQTWDVGRLTQCWFDAGPASQTVGQRYNNIESRSSAYWGTAIFQK